MAPPTQEELLDFLIDSARYGDTDDVKKALEMGAAVNGVDVGGRTGARVSSGDSARAQKAARRRPPSAAIAAAIAPGSAIHTCRASRFTHENKRLAFTRPHTTHEQNKQRCTWRRPMATRTSPASSQTPRR